MKLPTTPEPTADPKKPKSTWDTIITSTPVVMAVLATILAGLSASEGSQAQYYRSMSAQKQAKASDQWGFFQAKKQRSTNSALTVKILQNLGDISPLSADSVAVTADHLIAQVDAGSKLNSEETAALQAQIAQRAGEARDAVQILIAPLPAAPALAITDASVRQAFEALKKDQGDATPPALLASVREAALHEALRAAEQNVHDNDVALGPMTGAVEKLRDSLDGLAILAGAVRRATTQPSSQSAAGALDRRSPGDIRQLAGDFTAAELRFDAARHDREAKLNQQIAYLYEIAVRKSSWQADRHLTRSHYFFYGMLAAQAAVTIATLSLAVRERSWMWSVAAAIGLMAVSYAGYVYVFT
jgi:hypothetical protein